MSITHAEDIDHTGDGLYDVIVAALTHGQPGLPVESQLPPAYWG